jgi:hypothetical protein
LAGGCFVLTLTNNVLPRSTVPRLVHTNNLPNFFKEWSFITPIFTT